MSGPVATQYGPSDPRTDAQVPTGSVCSVLPSAVLAEMWLSWFQMPVARFPVREQIWHERADRFAKHDILFEFKDFTGRTYVLRCNAEPFLTSPWRRPNRSGWWSQFKDVDARDVQGTDDVPQWTLGMVGTPPCSLLMRCLIVNIALLSELLLDVLPQVEWVSR